GGGWDFTCRTIGRLLTEGGFVQGQVQTTNMPGGVGAVTFANIMTKRPNDDNLLIATSTVGITQIAQGKYPGDVDAMRWLGMLGADVGVLMVQKDSPFNSAKELMDAYIADPSNLATGGSSSIGGWDHLRLLLLARAAGMADDKLTSIKWVQYEGGGDAVTQLLGGHIAAVLTDIGEIAGFIESGDVKVLAIMADDRLKGFPDLPTAKEQGLDVTGYNWRGFYMGGQVSDEAYDAWVKIMGDFYKTDAWQKAAVENGLTPIFRAGPEFEEFVKKSKEDMTAVSKAIGVIK
ncbi:MAG: tripartite tricarboxylate transporter substrate binding protein, partial [Rhodobiaceae bacterium]|nr:tripartite tricarboxylate transporter substrate binding protein [Rhodobiaceae bacterium]